MAGNDSGTLASTAMVTQLDLDELKFNINDMFLIVNGIIVSREYENYNSKKKNGKEMEFSFTQLKNIKSAR